MYSNAGHNPPMLFTGSTVRRLEEGGVPLGLFPDAEFLEETVHLRTGDVLVLFSDGVSEAANAVGDVFGDEGVIACVSAIWTRTRRRCSTVCSPLPTRSAAASPRKTT